MRLSLRHPLVLVVAVLFVVSACGAEPIAGPAGGPDTTTTNPPPGELPADQVVWQVESGGGLVPMETTAASVPVVTIYGDGRVFVATWPRPRGPARLQAAKVDAGDLAAFLAEAERSGLFQQEPVEMGDPQVTDLGTTAALLHTTGAARRVSAYAFGNDFDDGLTVDQRARRHELGRLLDAGRALGAGARPWHPDRVRITDVSDLSDRGPDPGSEPPWPGPALAAFPTDRDAFPGPCLVVADATAPALYDAALANPGTTWQVGGQVRSMVVAPLLPGSEGCRTR